MKLRGYEVVVESIAVRELRIELVRPVDPDALLDAPDAEARFAHDEYLPYWATLWPAARDLAHEVAQWPRVQGVAAGPCVPGHTRPAACVPGVDSVDVLELGCGLGLVGLVAAARGYRVTMSDWDEDALAFVRASAERNALPEPATLRLDWRLNYPDLRPARILAADVLYEARNLQPIAEFVRGHLRPGGTALVADANRSTADAFPEVARGCGLEIAVRAASMAEAHGRVFELRHAAMPVAAARTD